MTSDQSSFPQIPTGELAVADGTDWSNDTAVQARGATRVFEQGNLRKRPGVLRQVYDCAHEDIARLGQILRGHQCTAIMRGTDGVELPLNTPILRSQATASAEELPANPPGASRTVALNAPIYGADGCLQIGRAHV